MSPSEQVKSRSRYLANTHIIEQQMFKEACEVVGIKPTRRQASKWRRKKGLARVEGLKILAEKEKARQAPSPAP